MRETRALVAFVLAGVSLTLLWLIESRLGEILAVLERILEVLQP
jgi:hypothetical protein